MRILPLLFCVALGLAACSNTPELSFDYSTETDFAAYQSYRWYDDVVPSREAEYREFNSQDKRVREYFGNELKRLGYREQSNDKPDFLVNYHISKQDHLMVSQFSHYDDRGVHGSVAAGTYGSAVSIGYSTGSKPRTYKEGTVVMDIIDADSMQLVWRGIAEGRLPREMSPGKRNQIVAALSRELLQDFPPQPSAER